MSVLMTGMLALLTRHGTLVVLAEDGGLAHRPLRPVGGRGRPATLAIAAASVRPSFQSFIERTATSPVTVGADWADDAVTLHAVEGRNLVRVACRDRFLSAGAVGGGIGWSDGAPSDWEEFLALDAAELATLELILAHDWIVRSTRALVPADETAFLPGFVLRIGELDVPLERQALRGGDGATPPFALTLLRDGWRIDEIVLFRPLIFSASFNSPLIHAQLFECLRSLRSFGGFHGPVHVVTELDAETILRAVPEMDAASLTVQTLHPTDFVGYVGAKYGILEHVAAWSHQPLLYLDPDVMADASLLAMLIDIALSRDVCAPVENHRPRVDSVGRDLLLRDRRDPDASLGVNAGTIGIPNLATCGATLALIRRSFRNILEMEGRAALPWVDQETFNYVSVATALDVSAIDRYVRIGTERHIASPRPASGLVHFWATPKDRRHLVMREYGERLRARAKAAADMP